MKNFLTLCFYSDTISLAEYFHALTGKIGRILVGVAGSFGLLIMMGWLPLVLAYDKTVIDVVGVLCFANRLTV